MKVKILGLFLSLVILIAGCNESDSRLENQALVNFKLVDDPIEAEAILIDLVGLEYKLESAEDNDDDDSEDDSEKESNKEGSDDNDDDPDESSRMKGNHDDDNDDGEWFIVDIEPQIINILELQNGAEALLAQSEIPAGELKEIRLILGDNNEIVVDGDTMDLKVPSGGSSGYKIKVNSEIEAGELYDIVIDFVASKSIVKKGNGGYLLKPVLKAKLVHDDDPYGSISGIISPSDLEVLVHAINVEDDTTSTQPSNGAYFIDLLWPGTYTVVVETGDESGFEDVTIEDVVVIEEQTTDLEPVTFE